MNAAHGQHHFRGDQQQTGQRRDRWQIQEVYHCRFWRSRMRQANFAQADADKVVTALILLR